jgi:hypothetical protein
MAPAVPTLVWGRDEARAGEMWNSNSVVAWLLVGAGLPADRLTPPCGGRSPGWSAGVAVARRGGATAGAYGRVPAGTYGEEPAGAEHPRPQIQDLQATAD